MSTHHSILQYVCRLLTFTKRGRLTRLVYLFRVARQARRPLLLFRVVRRATTKSVILHCCSQHASVFLALHGVRGRYRRVMARSFVLRYTMDYAIYTPVFTGMLLRSSTYTHGRLFLGAPRQLFACRAGSDTVDMGHWEIGQGTQVACGMCNG